MIGARIRQSRVWGGLGLILLGVVIGGVTFVSVMGPVLGLILVAVGVFMIGWSVSGSRWPKPPPSSRP